MIENSSFFPAMVAFVIIKQHGTAAGTALPFISLKCKKPVNSHFLQFYKDIRDFESVIVCRFTLMGRKQFFMHYRAWKILTINAIIQSFLIITAISYFAAPFASPALAVIIRRASQTCFVIGRTSCAIYTAWGQFFGSFH